MAKPTIAIVGLNGSIAKPLVQALTSPLFRDKFTFPLHLISRSVPTDLSDDSDKKYFEASSAEGYEKALQGIDIVVDARQLLALQDGSLLVAAKNAGVKVYVPSDYGLDYYNIGEYSSGFGFQVKIKNSAVAESYGLKVVHFSIGLFLEEAIAYAPSLTFVDPKGAVTDYPDDGSKRVTFTSVKNIAYSVASILSKPISEIPTTVHVAGDTLKLSEIAEIYEEYSGRKLTRNPTTAEELDNIAKIHLAKPVHEGLFDIIRSAVVNQPASIDFSEGNDNALINPNLFQWEKFRDAAKTHWSK